MAKTKPIITHTEILCLAIHKIEDEIERWQQGPKNLGPGADEEFSAMIRGIADNATAPLLPKLEALKEMYRIETGTEFV